MQDGIEVPPAKRLRQRDPALIAKARARVRRLLAYSAFRIPAPDREDLEQEILVQMWQLVSRPGFDDGPGFWKLLEVVSCRRAIDWRRAQRTTETVASDPSDPRPNPLGEVLDDERRHLARQTLEQLPRPCRELVRLHVVEQKSYAEIARLQGRKEGALRVQMFRCVQQARSILRFVRAQRRDSKDDRERSA
ncbi:MAG: sigma-70 family RNA polymerase sigma factor [Acidobacteriota bacterium]